MYVDCLPSVGYGGGGGGGGFQVKSTQLLTPMFLNQFFGNILYIRCTVLKQYYYPFLLWTTPEYSRAENETLYIMYKIVLLADMVFCLHRRLRSMKLLPLYDFFAVV